jgi:DeoR family fructose operon transcriptional repressor
MKGLLKASIINDNPVVFLENELLYGEKMEIDDDAEEYIEIGKARKVQEGDDITIISYSYSMKATTEAVVGSGAIRNLEAYNFTKGFFGTNGISTQSGFSTPDADEGEVKGEALKRCKHAYVLADRSKFNRVAPITFGSISSATIITGPLEDKKYRDFTNILEADE